MSEGTQGKCWCFTKHYGGVGQPNKEECEVMFSELASHDAFNYYIIGDEVAPSTGSKHFQGYVQFDKKLRITQVTKLVPHCTWLLAIGSDQHNFVYCSKSGNFKELGERRDTTGGAQGKAEEVDRWKRARLAAERNRLDECPDDIYVRNYGSLTSIAKDHLKLPDDAAGVTGVWIFGSAGVGKSRRARVDYPDAYFKLANKWFDGFRINQHKNCILDDFGKEHACLGHHLKIWGDRYAFIAETKGGAIGIRPQNFVVTSQYAPEDIWTDKETIDAIRRRYRVLHMRSPTEIGIHVPDQQPVQALILPVLTTQPPVLVQVVDEEEEE